MHFRIINIFPNKIENPIQLLPFPFTYLEFLKRNDKFYVIFGSFVEDEKWEKRWEERYYFKNIEKQLKFFSGITMIKPDEKYAFYEEKGGVMIEVFDYTQKLEDAFKDSLVILNDLINRAENSMAGLDKFIKLIDIWNKNKENKNEEFWQKTFEKFSWVIAQCFSMPVMLFQKQGYVGGKSISNKNGNIVDYVFESNFTGNLALVEIKNPQSNLLGKVYRNTYAISSELTGSINQLLNYKNSLQKEFYMLQRESGNEIKSLNSRCLLIVGRFGILNDKQKECFELFRSEFKSIDVVTFDEVFLKVENMFRIIKYNQSN